MQQDPRLIAFARANRREATQAEKIVWAKFRRWRVLGLAWRRQHPIEPYIVDFACTKAKVVLEIDGDSHAFQEEYDAVRSENLESQGWLVVRATNSEILRSSDAILDNLYQICESRIRDNSLSRGGEAR